MTIEFDDCYFVLNRSSMMTTLTHRCLRKMKMMTMMMRNKESQKTKKVNCTFKLAFLYCNEEFLRSNLKGIQIRRRPQFFSGKEGWLDFLE